jgi:glucose-6-phosphate 1-dehydrogenase
MDTVTGPTILVIVGITGDLARRKLLPAIVQLAEAGKLPEQFKILGISRRTITTDEVLHNLNEDIDTRFLGAHMQMFTMDLEAAADYGRLALEMDSIASSMTGQPQRLFYLSVPPQSTETIVEYLGNSGIAKTGTTKLLLEKPFGFDLASAEAMIAHISEHFDESQVYRIDHYLAKEMAQNIIVFRSGNSLFKRTWSNEFVESIEIIAAEALGIEGRATFYEQTGALRDLVQSHLMQLAALTIMEVPPTGDPSKVPAQRLSALRQLQPLNETTIKDTVVRGQYEGYKEEAGNTQSSVETFVSLTLNSDDPKWTGVPITLATGKALDTKTTEIRVNYHRQSAGEANELVLRIQPHEGVELCLWSKRPGYERQLEKVWLRYSYGGEHYQLPDAYGQVVLDAVRSDHTLFTSSDEVLAAWRVLDPVLKAWGQAGAGITVYPRGSSREAVEKLAAGKTATA